MKQRHAPVILWLCAILAAGCAAPPAPSPPDLPTPQTLHIQFAPAMRPLLPALRACLAEYPQLAPFMDERPPTRLEPQSADLTLWWGDTPPESGFAFLLGYDSLRVAASPGSEAANLTPPQVAALYRGGAPPAGESESLSPIQVWTYPQGHPFRAQFERDVLSGTSTTTLARLAPHPQAMQEAIANSPQAVGFLPGMWLSDTLSALPIELPAQPVLVLSPQEPQGAARNLLACWKAALEGRLSPRP